MNTPQNIEEKLWDYIDGSMEKGEQEFIEQLLQNNQEWKETTFRNGNDACYGDGNDRGKLPHPLVPRLWYENEGINPNSSPRRGKESNFSIRNTTRKYHAGSSNKIFEILHCLSLAQKYLSSVLWFSPIRYCHT